VRYKAIVQGLISSPLPQEHLTSFLVTLLEDDNYFPENFFYEQVEEAILKQRNTLKGTRNMIIFYEREEDFNKVKKILDDYYKDYIEIALNQIQIETTDLIKFKEIYENLKKDKTNKDLKNHSHRGRKKRFNN
jgi:hypothetical protein